MVDGKIQLQSDAASTSELGLGDIEPNFAEYAFGQLLNLTISGPLTDGPVRINEANALLHLAAAIEPKDEVEAALAAQLAMLHHLALDCGRRAMNVNATMDGRQQNISQAGKLSRSYGMLLDALARHRGKVTTQRVVVENVTVQAGGQAVVGAVAGAGTSKTGDAQAYGTYPTREDRRRPSATLPRPDAERPTMYAGGDQGSPSLQAPRVRARKRRAEGQQEQLDPRRAKRGSDRGAQSDERADQGGAPSGDGRIVP